MGEAHIFITLAGVAFNIVNGSAIGAWLGGYSGKLDVSAWQVAIGSVMFFAGLVGNLYHEEILRDIRRIPKDEGPEEEKVMSEDGSRVYRIPQGGLFRWVWFPHVSYPVYPNYNGL